MARYRPKVEDEQTRIEERALEVERIDLMIAMFTAKALEQANVRCAELALTLSEHKARLMGLYAPIKTEAQLEVAPKPEGQQKLIDVLNDLAAQRKENGEPELPGQAVWGKAA